MASGLRGCLESGASRSSGDLRAKLVPWELEIEKSSLARMERAALTNRCGPAMDVYVLCSRGDVTNVMPREMLI